MKNYYAEAIMVRIRLLCLVVAIALFATATYFQPEQPQLEINITEEVK